MTVPTAAWDILSRGLKDMRVGDPDQRMVVYIAAPMRKMKAATTSAPMAM